MRATLSTFWTEISMCYKTALLILVLMCFLSLNFMYCNSSFRCSVQVSAPYNATLHTKHFTNLFSSYFSKDLQKMLLFLLKSFFYHCYPLLYFLTAVHVAIYCGKTRHVKFVAFLGIYRCGGFPLLFSSPLSLASERTLKDLKRYQGYQRGGEESGFG